MNSVTGTKLVTTSVDIITIELTKEEAQSLLASLAGSKTVVSYHLKNTLQNFLKSIT